MKTHISVKILILFSFVSVIILSCSKKDDGYQPVSGPSKNPEISPIGSIIDSGFVSLDTKVMKMELSTLPYTLYNSDNEVTYISASASVAFYVNQEGSIPAGEYTFSNSESKVPFTFDSGVLQSIAGDSLQKAVSHNIVDGRIIMTHDGDNYSVSFKINLASGMTTSEIFTGSLAYADSK